MASIRSRVGKKGTTWSVLFRHQGKQASETFATEANAQQFRDMVERMGVEPALRVLNGRQDAPASAMPSVAQQLARHIENQPGITDGTRETYRLIARQIGASALGPMPLDCVTRDDVAAWIRSQETAGSASKTIRNRQGLLSAAMRRAVEDGLINRNPAHRMRIVRTERKEMTFLTPVEFTALLAAAPAHYRPFLMALFGTGLRFGELTALRPRDLSLNDTPPTLTVARAWKHGGGYGPPKTSKGRRTISLPKALVDEIRPLTIGKRPDDLVFTNMAGARVRKDTLHAQWKTWIAKSGIEKSPRIHDLRHSHASWMIGQGVSLFDLRQQLGHESIQTTADIYGHLLPEAQAQAERAAALAFAAITLPQIGA